MSRMSIRSTYALDTETTSKIKRLAGFWGVSQAEVIRRSVKRAAEQVEGAALSPAEVVMRYRALPPLRSAEETRALVESLRQLRHEDDARRGAVEGA